MGAYEGRGARGRVDAVFLGAKDHRHHSYRNAAPMDSHHGGVAADALALVKGGVPITKISIGHMQAGEGKRPATPTVAVDDTDVAAFKELQELGIELEIRSLPSSNPDPIQLVVGDTLGTWGRSF